MQTIAFIGGVYLTGKAAFVCYDAGNVWLSLAVAAVGMAVTMLVAKILGR